MSRPPDPLDAELSEVLRELDAAVAARFSETRSQAARRRREEVPAQSERLRGAVSTALRWLGRSRPSPEPPSPQS